VPHAEDDKVVAWPIEHTRPDREQGQRKVTFKIEAQWVKETEEGKAARLFWAKAQTQLRRHQRKVEREERMAKRKELKENIGHVKDEL
jgi:hypothetical protein